MSITDELREWKGNINTRLTPETVLALRSELNCIADRIDREHRMALEKVAAEADALPMTDESMAEHGWIRLPLDADGVTIRIGDEVTCGATVWTVTGLKFLGYGWGICCTVCNEYGGSSTSVYPPSDMRHYHALTVEDVLREFHERMTELGTTDQCVGVDRDEAVDALLRERAELVAEYAAKLRLAEEVDA